MRSTSTMTAISAAAAIAGVLTFAALARQQQQMPNGAQQPDLGKMLVDGLKNTNGCLGVDRCQWADSGRLTICAWFEDKAAVVRWFDSPAHVQLMRALGDDPAKHEPLADVSDDVPVMVMATMTVGKGQPLGPFPASQFSVELYTPLPGGAAINGRLAPNDFKIPHFNTYKPDTEGGQGKGQPDSGDRR
ncbi:MAG: hypothetical protein KDA20_04395 [Phycisphaerales bacterium]|nr:hypothetical protein [Phycisphaerales bacterium]